MRAAFVIPGSSGGRLEIRDVEAPTIAPDRVLVRVKASGLNRGEILYKQVALKGAPFISGVEFAGEVAAIGADVTGLRVGQRVMGHSPGAQADVRAIFCCTLHRARSRCRSSGRSRSLRLPRPMTSARRTATSGRSF